LEEVQSEIPEFPYNVKLQNSPPGIVTVGHWIVDLQVTAELVMPAAMTVHVTLLRSVAIVSPSFSIVSDTSMVPHTGITEHVYVTLSLTSAEVLSTAQFGTEATKIQW